MFARAVMRAGLKSTSAKAYQPKFFTTPNQLTQKDKPYVVKNFVEFAGNVLSDLTEFDNKLKHKLTGSNRP